MKKTIMILGDEEKTFKRFANYVQQQNNSNIIIQSYSNVFDYDLPDLKEVCVFPFFPEQYWNEDVEGHFYEGIYGNYNFYVKLLRFFEKLNNILNEIYFKKKLTYINNPFAISLCRDKLQLKQTLIRNHIPVPEPIYTRNYKQILSLLEEGEKLFIKTRCGSMGKGITMLEKNGWHSNFDFNGNRIVSRHADHGWTFQEFTDNFVFLQELLKQDVIIEKAVDCKIIDDKIFDLRTVIYKGEIRHIYPRFNSVENIITNISQGGKRATIEETKVDNIEDIEQIALKVVKTLGLDFAGVDIMIDKNDRPYVLEANSFPGFEMNFEKILYEEIKKEEIK